MSHALDNGALDEGWLGTDLRTWSQSIRNGYIRAFIIFALHETGVFDTLRKSGAQSSDELAAHCSVNRHLLDGVLHFLLHADVVLAKDSDERFRLTRRGEEWLFSDAVLAMSFGAVGAYSPILSELVPCLREEKRYGVDFEREGAYLAKGSYYTGRSNYPWVVSRLRDLDVRTVVDLGCGSANVLISFCQIDTELRGIGIDIAPRALEEARRRVEAEGLQDRIELQLGDLTDPSTYASAVERADAFNGIMVFHEFLRDGEEAVVDIFRAMKERFPGRYLLVGEFDRLTDDEFGAMPYPDRIHPLFYQHAIHPLTWQGLPQPKDKWLELFERAGLELVEVNDAFPFRLVEFILRF